MWSKNIRQLSIQVRCPEKDRTLVGRKSCMKCQYYGGHYGGREEKDEFSNLLCLYGLSSFDLSLLAHNPRKKYPVKCDEEKRTCWHCDKLGTVKCRANPFYTTD